MTDIEPGDEVVLLKPYWHLGVDIGGRRARVVSASSYVMVNVYDYENNPVKCFKRELSKAPPKPAINTTMPGQMEPEDWDSLFSYVDELMDTDD